jgi:asparagine synthase (glutamine-hydrolysing)
MTLMAGYVHGATGPPDPDLIRVLESALAVHGGHGRVLSLNGAVFGVTVDAGHGLRHACQSQPLLRHGSGLFMAMARLDDGPDLGRTLKGPQAENPEVNDQELVARVFERWGEGAPERLSGDWALASWDGRRLFLARDKLGFLGLHYHAGPGFIAFATNWEVLRRLPGVPRELNEEYILRYLAIIPNNDLSHTYWRGVHTLLPGRHLTFIPGNAVQVRRYWNLAEVPEIRLSGTDDYMEGFRERFREAVRVRLGREGNVATTLSAGLDSGSVTALAADLLGQSGRELTAFTSVPAYSPAACRNNELRDEWPLAHKVALHFGSFEHVALDSRTISPVTALKRCVEIIGHPMHAAANVYWILDLFDEVRRRGFKTLLTGAVGNATVSWNGGGERIFHLLTHGDVSSAISELHAWRRHHGCSRWEAFRRQILAPIFRRLTALAPKGSYTGQGLWRPWQCLHPSFAQRMGLRSIQQSYHDGPYGRLRHRSPRAGRLVHLELNTPATGNCWHAFEHHYGFRICDPTLDVRLVEYCFGIPEFLYTIGGGERTLIRKSMNGLLPDAVRQNTLRGRQAADVGLRLASRSEDMKEVLNELARSVPGQEYLNLNHLRKMWAAVTNDPWSGPAKTAAQLLLRSLMLYYFTLKQP